MEFSTNKITPNDNIKIPSMNGDNSGYQLDSELREYIQEGVTGVTEEYSNLSTYAYGKRLKHEGVEYRCIVPVETPENFDPDKWVKVDLTELDKRVLANADAINAINAQIASVPPASKTYYATVPLVVNGNGAYMGYVFIGFKITPTITRIRKEGWADVTSDFNTMYSEDGTAVVYTWDPSYANKSVLVEFAL